jgi:hypothetical protein
MQSMRIPVGIQVTLFEGCLEGRMETFEGRLESSDGSGFAGLAKSFRIEELVGGCCQISATDNTCWYQDYDDGRCIVLPTKTISCDAGFWVERATYDEASNTCIRELTTAEAELLAQEIQEEQEVATQQVVEQLTQAVIEEEETTQSNQETLQQVDNTIEKTLPSGCFILRTKLDTDMCFDASGRAGSQVTIQDCDPTSLNQIFVYHHTEKHINLYYTQGCLNVDISNANLDPLINFW